MYRNLNNYTYSVDLFIEDAIDYSGRRNISNCATIIQRSLM